VMVEGSRRRALSPDARSSRLALSAHRVDLRPSKISKAVRRCVRASILRRARRRNMPLASSVRARSKGRWE
jgi:hypothetical protein